MKSKRVAVVSDVYGQRGGAYRVTALLCRALVECGYDVTAFLAWVDADALAGDEKFEIVRPGVSRGHRFGLPNRSLARRATRWIRYQQPTAVFCVGLTNLCGHLLSGNVANQAFVWELTNATPNNKFVDIRAARQLYRCRCVLSPASEIDRNIRLNYGYRQEIRRLPFWIEDDGKDFAKAPDAPVADFLFLARRENDKGLRELIAAAATVGLKYPEMRVLIAGLGDPGPWKELVEQSGAEQWVEFCSLPERQDAMRTLANSRWLVLPSYHEGYPLSLLEAAQESVPFIATDVGSIREVFEACEGCHIIPPRDSRALADAMCRAMYSTGLAYENARSSVYRRFAQLSSEVSVHKTLESLVEGCL